MLARKKTLKTKSGREFTFEYPTFTQETEIQTEVLRRMSGILSLTPHYDRIFVMHYFNIAFERLTVEAPDSYYESITGPDGEKKRFINISKFYEDDEEFMEARKLLSDFLDSFRRSNKDSEVLSSGNGAEEVEGAKAVSPPAPVSQPGRDVGRSAAGD